MKKLFIALSLVVATLTAGPAFAHGQGGVGVFVGPGGFGISIGGGNGYHDNGYWNHGYYNHDYRYRPPYRDPGWGHHGPGWSNPPVIVLPPPVYTPRYRIDRCGSEYYIDNYGYRRYTGRYYRNYDYCY